MADEETPAEEKKKGGKKKLIIIIVVLALLGFGAKTVLLKPPKKANAADAVPEHWYEDHEWLSKKSPKDEHKTNEEMLESVGWVTLDSRPLSLQNGRYLKVGFSVHVVTSPDPKAAHGGGGGGGHGEKKFDTAAYAAGEGTLVLNEAVYVFSALTYEELTTAEGKKHAQEELEHRVRTSSHGTMFEVRYTEFVLQ